MFLPISKLDMEQRGIHQLDFILVTGDAYVDHPSFGAAIIARVLERDGFTVGIIAQPDWRNHQDIMALGAPRHAFLVTGGNIDSMVNHYSVTKKRRKEDVYTPGDIAGKRPDRATIVYANLIRQAFGDVPIIIGGIEASLRRMGHYDYWSDQVRRSILLDSQADLLLYGMAEKSITQVGQALESGIHIKDITFIKGTCYRSTTIEGIYDTIVLPSFKSIKTSKEDYAKSFLIQSQNTDAITAKTLVETYGEREYIVQLPPQAPLTESEFDSIYGLNYERTYHPSYESLGGISAIKEVKFSIISNRGCYGACNFCALTFHQGRVMQARSAKSIVREAESFVDDKDFKGYIHDVGGPTANFRKPSCQKQLKYGVCKDKQCLFPQKCENLDVDHTEYVEILRKLRNIPKVKKVFVRSGIRFDYLMYDKDPSFFNELCEHHISGQLKVAPEHVDHEALSYMGKPDHAIYERFTKRYEQKNVQLDKKQFLVPYLMSSHPGSTLQSAIKLALYLRDIGHQPQQVQDFYPTPATASTTMYYTGLDPRTMKPVFVPKKAKDKAMQRALIQYKKPQNYELVKEALLLAGREDLIGFDRDCLIRPRQERTYSASKQTQSDPAKKEGATSSHKSNHKGSSKRDSKNSSNNSSKSNLKTNPKQKRKTIRNVHKKKK
ncbi:conserved protein of unknown function [Petrocella atlantisensis]|uniref:Radical SAM core domain-containing protein n=1 Tax=Petrocella atlantisensis TaxID=2173034 RepID=A0A3P7PA17_9FIRM|nr:YgiQ family radical SAM protein [Petrocella atlantisensis]VDN45858.1 conserved protein of unknown function [Petrocella atlantisensis]